MTAFSVFQLHLIWALIVASMTAGAGKGHGFEAICFVLIAIFGVFDVTQFIVVTFLYIVLLMVNEFLRAGR